MPTFDEGQSEECGGVGQVGNVILRLLAMSMTAARKIFSSGREKGRFWCIVNKFGCSLWVTDVTLAAKAML
jgi:hypothetical protein